MSVAIFLHSLFLKLYESVNVDVFCDDCLVLCIVIAYYGVDDVLREFRRGGRTVIAYF